MPATRYFTDDVTAVPYPVMADFLAQSSSPWFARAIARWWRIRRALRWPHRPTHATGELGSERRVARSELPARALARMAPFEEQFADLGFQPLHHAVVDTLGERGHVVSVLLSESGDTLATLEWMVLRGGEGVEERTVYEFNSYGESDPEVMTGAAHPNDLPLAGMFQIEFVDLEMLSNRLPARAVLERHRARLGRREVYRLTPEAAAREYETRRLRRFEWLLASGLLRELRPAEVDALRRRPPGVEFNLAAQGATRG